MGRLKKIHKGFTLIELLVVVAIIGLLTGMLVISIQHIKAKARDGQRVADINSIATALTLYHNDFNNYPAWTEGGYINGNDDPLSVTLENAGTMHAVPVDPLNVDDYQYYYQSVDGTDYYLEYYLETDSISGKSKGRNYFVP
jgi:general secretion pathway protein G